MSPTVCYHFYNANAGRILAEGTLGATAVSPCYRYEGKPTTGLRRLREFTMREIIFIWPDETAFYPGHGSSGEIGTERPAFEAFSASGWSSKLRGDVTWE